MIQETREPAAAATAVAASGPPEVPEVPTPPDRDAMIGLMRGYREARREREEAEENGAAYVAQVREEVKRDLAPMREREERLRGAMLVFVREHNGGAPFRVPGLGTAHTQRHTATTINDPEALVEHLKRNDPEALVGLYDRKLNEGRAKKLAEASAKEDGELLPGAETEERESLVVKFA